MIIETSDNRFFRVTECGDASLAHCWYGIAVKRVAGQWVPKVNARQELVRKAATRPVIEPGDFAEQENVAEQAFDRAIAEGRLSTNQRAANYAGNYMYMGRNARGDRDTFKHHLTRQHVA